MDKRFRPKPASYFSAKDRTPSCLSHIYHPNEKEMKQVFEKLDRDKDGKISRCDLKQLFTSLKEDLGDQVRKMVQAADFDGDEHISLNDFMELHKKISSCEIRSAFRMYDLDGDGRISADDLKEVLQRLGEKCTDFECKRMIQNVNTGRDGFVDVEDFMIMMTKTMKLAP